jgi:hypothetical protein
MPRIRQEYETIAHLTHLINPLTRSNDVETQPLKLDFGWKVGHKFDKYATNSGSYPYLEPFDSIVNYPRNRTIFRYCGIRKLTPLGPRFDYIKNVCRVQVPNRTPLCTYTLLSALRASSRLLIPTEPVCNKLSPSQNDNCRHGSDHFLCLTGTIPDSDVAPFLTVVQ